MRTDLTLSNAAFQQLTKTDKLDSNREDIKEHLMAGGMGDLTDKQKELLERWRYADEMIRDNSGRLSRQEIASLIKTKFQVSICTAKSDMVNAEYVFSSSNPLNKAYEISLRIEVLKKQSRAAAAANDHKAFAMIEKSLTEYIKMYPETTPVEVPKNLIFKFDVTKLQDRIIDQSEAEDIIDKQLEKNKLLNSMSTDIEEEEDDPSPTNGGEQDE